MNPQQVSPQFIRDGEGFSSLPAAEGRWAPGTLAGPAVAGLLAQVLDGAFGEGLVPARWHCDLFRMVRAGHVDVRTRLVRSGRRIRVAEAEIVQNDTTVVRASATFYHRAPQPDGHAWSDPDEPAPAPSNEYRLSMAAGDGDYAPFEGGARWNTPDRKRLWTVGWRVLDGEETTPFARAAMVSDCTNLVTGMGTGGVQTINGDVSMALARAPIGDEIGLEADQHLLVDGVSAASASMFDRHGRFGVCSVTGVATGSAVHGPEKS
ncbi:acyl-CoA thioesterase domain-containing protein [Tsukamurella sp. 1534]|uniref:acyl-CoA thioesterase domain-containing protein n=1 Tax=Tsukamurella sp. 1534 TaxID=1151061 RepID=UPI0002FD8733|nr:acyl-CoA thioesterase domain-containing protein [Tsukamurella sp. 1534]